MLLVGTRKGLWIGRSDEARADWTWTGPHFDMEEVYSCMIDTRGETPRLLAGASSSWLGPRVRRSDDLGETWAESPDGGIRFPEGTDASVERVWQLTPGARDEIVYAGSEPGPTGCQPLPEVNCSSRGSGPPVPTMSGFSCACRGGDAAAMVRGSGTGSPSMMW